MTDVFVTHTHMDHFIGFDPLLRVILRRQRPVNFYGPPGIIRCIAGKLRGYAWNLIEEYPTEIRAAAFDGKRITRASFRAVNRFRREDQGWEPSDGTLVTDTLFRVKAVRLDHGIPCLAYSLDEEYHINIDKDMLQKRGLSVGPWLSEFKRLIRENRVEDASVTVGSEVIAARDLLDIARRTEGQKIVYAADVALTPGNIRRLTDFSANADTFYCEAYFLEEDRDRAVERFHLTARAAGTIARQAGVKRLIVMHFSPKYRDDPQRVIDEAMGEFEGGRDE